MTKKQALQALYRLMVELYDDESKANMLADQSGIPTSAVAGRGILSTYWWNLVVAAHRHDKVQQLVMNASWDYPEKGVDLKQAFSGYESATDAGDDIRARDEEGARRVVSTGGGTYIGGSMTIEGDFIGRDKLVYGDRIDVGDISGSSGVAIGRGAQATVTPGLGGDEIASIFAPLMHHVSKMPEGQDKEDASRAVQALKAEARKGEHAQESVVRRWLSFLADAAPDAWDVAVQTFTNPLRGLSMVFNKVAEWAKDERGG